MSPNLPVQLLLLICSSVLVIWVVGNIMGVAALDVLKLGDSLTPTSQPLSSSSSTFMLSFRPPSISSASNSMSTNLFLAISFVVNSSVPGFPAWVANRNTSVSASASLTLSPSGDLLLSDPIVSPVPIWNSNTADLGVVQAQLLDSGNLVLLNRSSGYVWESFHYPTDTLLPGQDFTASSTSLISNRKSGDFVSGRFSLTFMPDGMLQILNIESSTSHWDAGKIAFFQFDKLGNITFYNSPSSINSSYISNDHGNSAIRRMTLDMDGNLRLYTWDETSSQWTSVWMALADVCDRVPGLCGSYGVCTYDPVQPTCVCPQGFSARDPTDLSSGCAANYKIDETCSNSSKYVEIEHVDFPYNDYLDFSSSSMDECKHYCSSYCKCLAAVYWQSQGHCWLKQTVENGAVRWSQMHRVFLKISEADPLVSSPILDKASTWSSLYLWQPESPNQSKLDVYVSNRKHFGTVIALAILLTIQTVCFAAVVGALITRHKRHLRYEQLGKELEGSLHAFSYEELKAASENFSSKIGAGGFGTVYKGQLHNGKLVAIKQLEGISQQEQQFRAEIVTLGRIHHINLLPLVGYCAEDNHRLLVYEYMGKGSLDGELFQGCDKSGHISVLDWSTRFQICLGVARGIRYLHAECLDCILHCDIKPENVLLDTGYCPKVADFGLAYLYSRNHTLHVSTIRGTRGYLAPEWVSHLPITAKADVYSYGMLLMEVVSGRKNYLYTESSMMEANEKWCFPIWAYGRRIEEVVDARLNRFPIDWEQVELVLKVAFACIQADMNARPSMGKVVQMLEGMLPVPDAPPPSFIPNDAQHVSSASMLSTTITSSSSTSSRPSSISRNARAGITSSFNVITSSFNH